MFAYINRDDGFYNIVIPAEQKVFQIKLYQTDKGGDIDSTNICQGNNRIL